MSDKQRELLTEAFTSVPVHETASNSSGGSNNSGLAFSGFDDDGIANWTIPLNVSVGIEGMRGGGRTAQTKKQSSSRRSKKKAQPPRKTVTDSADFALAMRKAKEHEADTYYDAAADLAANIEYYDGIADDLVGDELFEALSQLVSGTHTTTLAYKEARLEHLYPWICLLYTSPSPRD